MDRDTKLKAPNHLSEKLAQTKLYYDFFQNIQKTACTSSNVSLININEFILEQIKNSDFSKKIANQIIATDESTTEVNSQNSYITKAQANWEKKIIKILNTMSTEYNIPLSRKRNSHESHEIKRLWNELGTNVPDLKKINPIYKISEFLECILAIKSNNLNDVIMKSFLGLISVPIRIKNLTEIKQLFKNLSIDHFQSGLDESLNSVIDAERLKIGHKVIEVNDLVLSREFSKQGCITSIRSKLWSQMMNVNLDHMDTIYYNYLMQCVLDHDLFTDTIYYKDVKTIPTNDDQVFVFEDLLYQTLLIFSRDTHILKCYEKYSVHLIKGTLKNMPANDPQFEVVYPPNGFIPFESFSMLVSPLCYVYSDPIFLYFMFRKVFMTHFIKLYIISTDPESIVGLCSLFETVLQSKDIQLFIHLKKIDCQPLKIVFKWLIRAFSGYLASSQLLELWDRMLALNTLEILPIFAVGVFLFRRQNIMSVSNKANVESILDDLTTLKTVAILQLVLL